MSDFYGLPTDVLRNEYLEIEYLASAGPRLVGLRLAGSQANLLAELPDLEENTPYGTYRLYGGHRLWHAPEAFPRTYIPDNQLSSISNSPNQVEIIGMKEEATGLQKSMRISLHQGRPGLTIQHKIENLGLWPVQIAAWALTQLPLGGIAIFPQQNTPLNNAVLLPNRHLVLWPYTRWSDPRLILEQDYIFLKAQPILPPVKIGYPNRQGWIGYFNQGVFLRKTIAPYSDQAYCDFGCNIESYCNNRFIELETLSPLVNLEPGQMVLHDETWDLFPIEISELTTADLVELVRTLE